MSGDAFDILSALSPPSHSSPSASPPQSCRSENVIGQLFPEATESDWRTKDVILIRHGRSTWNEFLGAHKRAQWEEQEAKRQQQLQQKSHTGFRGALRSMVGGKSPADSGNPPSGGYPSSGGAGAATSDLLDLGAAEEGSKSGGGGGFWQGVRGGLKHVGNAINHAGKLNQVDHPLSAGGLAQVRQLRTQIAALAQETPEGPGASLLRCRKWYVSPFLRALQTAAYALAPLRRLGGEPVTMRVTPQANEIIQTAMSLDCQGKKGNVGIKVVTRAIGKIAETFEEDDDDPQNQALASSRQEELADATNTLCAMDISEVAQTWWSDVSAFKKEHLKAEDARVNRFVQRILLQDELPCVGVVAHSLLFKRLIQLFWPKDAARQEELRTALRNGASHDTTDPFHDKVMNCGTLVLTFRYQKGGAEIIKAAFLFDGHMESALARGMQTQEETEDMDGHYEGDSASARTVSQDLL